MKNTSNRQNVLIFSVLSITLALVGVMIWQLKSVPAVDKSKVYRIGYGNDVPFHFREDDGEPSGLAHDLVNEAAQRQGIQLEWVNGEKFLQDEMDFWVLMTIKADRMDSIHFTDPYLQTRTCFLVPASSRLRTVADLGNIRVSHVDYGVHREHLASYLPSGAPLPMANSGDAVQALLDGKADAAYLDQYDTLRAVLEGNLSNSMRVIDSGFPSLEFAIASTFQSAAVADTIRTGMISMARDGTANDLISRWDLFPSVTDNMVEGLVNAERRVQILTIALVFSVLALALSIWLGWRLRSQTIRLSSVQESLRQSANQYRAIVENTRDVVYSVGVDGIIKFLGPQASAYGIDPKEAISKNMLEFILDEDKEQVLQEFKTTLETGIEHTTEFRIPGPDGSEVWFEERGTLLMDTQNNPIGITGALRDITERKRAEAEQQKLESQLRHAQKIEAIGQLTGGIAHDFNNILAAMTINLDLLMEKPHPDANLRTSLSSLRKTCDRAAGLTRHLLTFSRRSVLEIRPLDLNTVVTNMLDMVKRLLGEDIQIDFHREHDPLPRIEADAGVLEQVLMNLCVNARDAMPRGGRILITTSVARRNDADQRTGTRAEVRDFVRLAISDTGCGMEPETLRKIFDPFFTTKDIGKGTGLGLATVQGSIAQHGGWIEVESQPNEGTTFEVFLPISKKTVVEPLVSAPSPTASGNELILVVEDEPTVLSMVTRALSRFGYDVLEATCGQEAMECWQQHHSKIGLLLTDVVLPEGMTGIELAKQLKQHRPDLPVIISSGYNNEAFAKNHESNSNTIYLPKPYSIVDLANAVRRCLDASTTSQHQR